MLSLALSGRVFVCVTPTDMRKSFDGLSAVVRDHLNQDPLAGDLFVFRNRRGRSQGHELALILGHRAALRRAALQEKCPSYPTTQDLCLARRLPPTAPSCELA